MHYTIDICDAYENHYKVIVVTVYKHTIINVGYTNIKSVAHSSNS